MRQYEFAGTIRGSPEKCVNMSSPERYKGYVIHEDAPVTEITLYMESLTAEEREIIKAGSLINFNKNRQM